MHFCMFVENLKKFTNKIIKLLHYYYICTHTHTHTCSMIHATGNATISRI